MNVIAWLRTPIATLIVLVAALASQVPHAADVFRLIVQGEGLPAILHGYAYAIALELAVLLFVVQKRDLESYIFAGVSVLVNLSYYSLHGIHLFSVEALPAWLVSIALPAAIARYSHLLLEESPGEAHKLATVATSQDAPQRKKAAKGIDDTTPAPIVNPSESGGHGEGAAQTGETSAQPEGGETPKPAKLSPAQRQDIIIARGYKTTAEVMQAFNIKERAANGDLAEVRKSLLQTNGTGAH